jgi:hypothetical protein
VPISWDEVIAYNLANNPGALFGPLTIFDNTGFKAATGNTLLPAFQGGFVKNLGSSDITIQIPFKGQAKSAGRVGVPGADINEDDWNVFLHISQNERTNQLGGFGMHRMAQVGADRFDNFNPPGFFGIPEVNFINEGVKYANDMINPQQAYEWTFIPSGVPGKTMQLEWNAEGSKKLFLFDEESLNVIDMTQEKLYDFVLTKNSRFRIFFGKDVEVREVIAGSAFPNPVNNEGRVTINLALPRSGSVIVSIYNAQGMLVTSIDRNMPAGIGPLEFTLPETLTSGIYIYRLAVSNDRNTSVHTGKIVKQ